MPPWLLSPGESVADSIQSAVGLLVSSIRLTPSLGDVVQVIECTRLPLVSFRLTIPLVFFMQNPHEPPSPLRARTM